jgi:hypothetical protein
MCKRGEGVPARENREKGEEGGEGEIQIQILSLRLRLNLYGEMSRLSSGRWLFTVPSRFRLEPLEAN